MNVIFSAVLRENLIYAGPQSHLRFKTVLALPKAARVTTSVLPRRRSSMKALVYSGRDTVRFEERPKPTIVNPTDAIVRIKHTTICGTDLHILKGDVPTIKPGLILGHEGVGVIEELGTSVTGFKVGDRALISCITACGACKYCRKGMCSHCETGGWTLGNSINGTQAEYVRVPHAMSSLYELPEKVNMQEAVMLSDALPTGMECGTLNGKVQPGCTVVIIGAGAVGLSVMMTASLYSPSLLVVVDVDGARLALAEKFGAHQTINAKDENAVRKLLALTNDEGFDAVIEAVGIPSTFELCQGLIAPGGSIANVGVHGKKVDLHLETLWDRNINIATRLVDAVTTPMLLKLFEANRLNVSQLITHHFSFSEGEKAYDVFKAASEHKALKVIINM